MSFTEWQAPQRTRQGAARPGPQHLGDAGTEAVVVRGRVLDGEFGVDAAEVVGGGKVEVTGADGRFRLALPADSDWVKVHARKGTRVSRLVRLSAHEPPSSELILHLATGGVLRVRVLTHEERQPVPGASVTVDEGARSATADDDGRLVLDGLPEGEIRLVAAARGFVSSHFTTYLAEGETRELELVLEPALSLRGRVVDSRGEGLPGAEVTARRLSAKGTRENVEARATSGPSGEFVLAGLHARAYRVDAHLDGYAPGWAPSLASSSEVVVQLELGAAVEGRVLDEAGQPVAEAKVVASAETVQPAPMDRPKISGETGPDGQYVLEGLVPGQYQVRVKVKGRFGNPERTIDLRTGERLVLDFALRGPPGRVEGVVVDKEDGSPIDGAEVRLGSKTDAGEEFEYVVTGTDGRFRFTGVESRSWNLVSRASGYAEGQLAIAPSETGVLLPLARSWWVSGRVLDPAGRPIPSFTVGTEDVTSAEGRFRISPAPQVESLVISARGYEKTIRSVAFFPGALVELGDIRLELGPLVEVTALAPDGRPVSPAWVYAVDTNEDSVRVLIKKDRAVLLALTDVGGRASFRALAGKLCFVAARFPYPPTGTANCPMQVVPGENRFTLHFAEPAWLTGSVYSSGVPQPGAILVAPDEDNSAVTDADGHYRLGPFSAGSHEILLLSGAHAAGPGNLTAAKVTLAAGEERRLDFGGFELAALVGEVLGAGNEMVVVAATQGHLTAKASASRIQGMAAQMLQSVNGVASFQLEGVSSGQVTLFVGRKKGAPLIQHLTLQPGERQRVVLRLPPP
ncbi:MAG: carboxypeptidase regulatory-like domain-containing protein [Myxococcota bacterium]